MLIEARSYSLALWLFAKGHTPIEAGLTPGGALVFVFSPSAAPDVTAYHDAKAIFNGLEARARVLHAARQRGAEVRA
jgi:hypothetical protein